MTDGHPAQAERLHDQADDQQRAAADLVGQDAGDRRDEDRCGRPGQGAQAGLERRVVLHGLQELRQQEDRAEHPEEHEQAGRRWWRRSRGCGTAASAASAAGYAARTRRRQRRAAVPAISAVSDLGAGPADAVAADDAEDDAEQAGAGQADAGQVEPGWPGRGSRSSMRHASGTRTMPIGTFSQKIHCQDAPSTTAPPTSGPIAMARPPTAPQAPRARPRLAGGTACDSRVSVSGTTIGAADALDGAGRDRGCRCWAPGRRPPRRG